MRGKLPCMPKDTQLTTNFWLSEFTISDKAERFGIANQPNTSEIENLRRLAGVLEVVRSTLNGAPIIISSGFRCPKLNTLVGSDSTSAHPDGRAADFIAPRFGSPKDICRALMTAGVVADQLIYEGSWVHLGIAVYGAQPRKQVLTAVFTPGKKTRYLPGLL